MLFLKCIFCSICLKASITAYFLDNVSLLSWCVHTKVHQFDAPLCRQQDVVAFDVSVDGVVGVQVLEALQRR